MYLQQINNMKATLHSRGVIPLLSPPDEPDANQGNASEHELTAKPKEMLSLLSKVMRTAQPPAPLQ